MTYQQAIDFLYSLELFGIKLGLDNITRFLQKLKNPQDSFKAIHVAGTNGKGSVASIFESVLVANGYKVGKFTSPHLYDFRERFHINKHKVSKKFISEFIVEHKAYIEGRRVTFFETCTGLAFELFRREKVDWAIVEVGLGGRLDATSLVKPDLTVITKIAKDHTKTLGDTIEKITFEKCGILKQGVPLVTSNTDPKVLEVINEHAKGKDVQVLASAIDSKFELLNQNFSQTTFQFSDNSTQPLKYTTNLVGQHQAENCSLVLTGLNHLAQNGLKLEHDATSRGLMQVFWPARMQYVEGNPSLILDCAHNPDGFKGFTNTIKTVFPGRKFNLLLGMLRRPDYPEIFNMLKTISKKIILTIPNRDRAPLPEALAREAIDCKLNFKLIPDVLDAYTYARNLTEPNDILLVAGSHFTLGEIMKFEKIPT